MGTVIGRFVSLGVLGRGGMGTVYEAFDRTLDRRIALKVLRDDARSEHPRRLVREAKALAVLSHPNVVQVFEVGEADGRTFVAMELVGGPTLRKWARRDPAPDWRECVDAYLGAAEGLAAAHERGLVHRDFKPSNVIMDERGRARVVDFGLARIVSPFGSGDHDTPEVEGHEPESSSGRIDSTSVATPLTEEGVVMGTPGYMPPEYGRSGTIDARGDQFSFCVALHEAIYGKRPFGSTSGGRSLVIDGFEPPELSVRGTRVPAGLRHAIGRGLSVHPEDRWPSMTALIEVLREQVAPVRRHRVGWIVGTVGLGLAAVAGSIVYQAELDYDARIEAEELALRCAGAREELVGVWDAGVAGEGRRTFEGTVVPYAADTWERVSSQLDGYADAWVASHDDACEATAIRGDQSEAVMDLRMRCLGRSRTALRATVAVLLEADEALVRGAVDMVDGLPSIEQCNDVEGLERRHEPAATPLAPSLRERAETAHALERAGAFDEAAEIVDALLEEEDVRSNEGAGIELLLLRARVRTQLGRLSGAEQDFEQAYERAVALGDEPAVVDAVLGLGGLLGNFQAQVLQGRQWGRVASPLVERLGDPSRRYRLLVLQALLADRGGDYDAAEQTYRRALELSDDMGWNLVSSGRVTLLNNFGVVLEAQGKHDEAEATYRRSLTVAEELLGPEHPELVHPLNGLGGLLSTLGRFSEAEAAYLRCRELCRTSLGPRHVCMARATVGLGAMRVKQGRIEEAIELNREGLEIWNDAQGPDHPDIAYAINNLAVIFERAGKLEEAGRLHRRALRIREAAFGPDHPEVANSLMGLTESLLYAGELEEARRAAKRALRIVETHGESPVALAFARFTMAEVLWREPERRPESRAMTEQAREMLAAQPEGLHHLVEMLDRWLEDHPL